jgi:nitroimidazol reductase NimA-like FMN-containing flavoprotein (pyridoxamine 5'-phosphate oxidase superfamily)
MPARGSYDRKLIYQILDAAFICHVGFVHWGTPFVIPTAYARVGDKLYIHGSSASRMLRTAGLDVELCVTVTLMDGLVLARSGFNHSINYRCVVVLGNACVIQDREEKMLALQGLTEHIIPGRWADVRPPTAQEMKATTVLAVMLQEASAKVRTGPPLDEEEDYSLNTWAGVIPIEQNFGIPIPDPKLRPDIVMPAYLQRLLKNK